MSHSSLLRIMAPLCGVLLLAHAPIALAQDDVAVPSYPAPAMTPEAAGEMFYQFLAAGDVRGDVRGDNPRQRTFDIVLAGRYVGSIARSQAVDAEFPFDANFESLLGLLAQQKDEPQFEGKVVGKEGEQTLVELAPAPAKKRAVVVIAEDGGYRVDVKATYGRWNDLSGEKLDIAWAEATGIISPTLAQNTTFIANGARSICQSNLKQAMLAMLQYSQDYDEKFPTARKWIDEVMPYVQRETIFHCPLKSPPDIGGPQSKYGYAFNQNLSGLSMARMNNVAQLVAIYETTSLVRNEFGTGDERAYRHLGGSNIAFADGHVKWYAQGSEPEKEVGFKP